MNEKTKCMYNKELMKCEERPKCSFVTDINDENSCTSSPTSDDIKLKCAFINDKDKNNKYCIEVSKKCDSMGRPVQVIDHLDPNFKYAYLKHYNTKTAEEYAYKILKGDLEYKPYESIEHRVELFFEHNHFTKEKLKVFEDKLNRSFPKFYSEEYQKNQG